MSTLPGLASKGEKGKSKFQSLDINNLYRVSLGESVENKQQKNTLSLKHGMQSLGKVPNARRPPANLPSLKSEHSGTDAAVSLVPSNGPGWGKQESSTASTTTTTTSASNSTASVTSTSGPQLSAHQAAIALPVTTTVPPQHKPPTAVSVTGDKSWSAVMSGTDPTGHPPPYQSPQFQHEFPSLSAGETGGVGVGGAGAAVRPVTADTQYGPGPSLRPQTEGSWIQGGSRGTTDGVTRNNTASQNAQPQLSAPVGQPLPPQYRVFIPPFMYRDNNSFPANGHAGPQIIPTMQPNTVPQGNRRQEQHHQQQQQAAAAARLQRPDHDEMAHRPIIKEEELSGMDNLTNDIGWALHDDIDYNQKLAFSDDDTKPEHKDNRKLLRTKDTEKTENSENEHKSWPRNRAEEDEMLVRRRQQQEVASAVLRAKQRKEEEEKKFLEQKQAATKKKLAELDEKIKNKKDKENDENIGTINPATVPTQPIASGPILLPEWERERDRPKQQQQQQQEDEREREKKPAKTQPTDFRHLTQLDSQYTFHKKEQQQQQQQQQQQRNDKEQQNVNFSRSFQSNLPPRFQKMNTGMQSQFDNRWTKTSPNTRKPRDEDKDREDDRYRKYSDDYRTHRYPEGRKSSESRYEEFNDFKKEKEEDKRRSDRPETKSESFDSISISRQNSDEWHGGDRRGYERPQRPDSRDSRASRESRHSNDSAKYSEQREYLSSWSHYEEADEKKKDLQQAVQAQHQQQMQQPRMQVPGPITKEKIEADDLRSEKRNLTQLKRGAIVDKKLDDKDKDDDAWSLRRGKDNEPRAWADAISPSTVAPENLKFMEGEKKSLENLNKIDEEGGKDDEKRGHGSNRGRSDSQNSRSGWAGNNVYQRSWSKKGTTSGRGGRGGGTRNGGDWHGTESEGSADDNSISHENSIHPKPVKKLEKDEKNKEMNKSPIEKKNEKPHRDRDYVPKGEPSRHGRGGSSFRGGRGGCKRIDGYGPPVKSPFSHNEDKDKKDEIENLDRKEIPKLDKIRKDIRRKPRIEGEFSDNSDDNSKDKRKKGPHRPITSSSRGRNAPQPPRLSTEKRNFGGPIRNDSIRSEVRNDLIRSESLRNDPIRNEPPNRQNSSGSLRSQKELETSKEEIKVEGDIETPQNDSDGFQEVKSKKTGKTDRVERPERADRPKEEKTLQPKLTPPAKVEKDPKLERKGKSTQLSQQQIANIPSLMATPVNPPANLPQPQNKTQFERSRQKLPPRLVKQRENNRLHKTQMQQGICDVNDMNKVNQGMYGLKETVAQGGAGAISNAWEKPLASQMRGGAIEQDVLAVGIEACKNIEQSAVHTTTNEDKTVLDGSKPLTTIIFENTNFKSAPGCRNRNDKRPTKLEDGIETAVLPNFNKPISELLGKEKQSSEMIMSYNKEDSADIKLDFFENEISHLTEDKASKSIGLPRTMHTMTSGNNTISPSTADALNIKIQSVKKVWESTPTIIEHGSVQDDTSFATGFDPNGLDGGTAFSKADTPDDNHEVYSPSPNNQNPSNSTANVCKVKPTQQVAGSAGQTVLSAGHQQHSGIVGPGIVGHALSPPPLKPILSGGVGLGQPQQYPTNQHINFQQSIGGNTQYGMPAIPSPPTVLYNSPQQLQAAQSGLYGTFQIDQSQVQISQGRSQYSQYSYGLGQTASSPYSQSMYLQTAQAHPPPTQQAPPDIYPSINNYRIPASAPFAQNQTLNNPTTVLISSTSNTLMSASVKPSNQQISAIGTKAGGVGQAYQQQSQQGQLYMTYDPSLQANYLQNAGVMGRGPAQVQNNVVTGLQPSALQSSSYYSGSNAGQTQGYFQQPGSSTLQSAQMSQHQASYGLQGNIFGTHTHTHNQSHTSAGMQNYASPYLSGHVLATAAINQQYRSNMTNTAYMKNVGGHQITDQTGRSQQLKSPGSQQEVLSSVFNSGSQIPSPKSRQTCKQPQPQPSPTTAKYMYPCVNQQNQQKYPAPIQRPNYQNMGGGVQNPNQKLRTNNANNRTTQRQYFGGQGGNLNTHPDKIEESKLNEVSAGGGTTKNAATVVNQVVVATAAAGAAVTAADKTNDAVKDENSVVNKD